MNGFIRSIIIELNPNFKDMEKELRTIKLMQTYSKFKSQQEKDWWVSSLRLEDKALVRKALGKNLNKLF